LHEWIVNGPVKNPQLARLQKMFNAPGVSPVIVKRKVGKRMKQKGGGGVDEK
jgi:hypothetical protein